MKVFRALLTIVFPLALASCDDYQRRELYDVCDQIDHTISARFTTSEIYKVSDLSDIARFRQLAADELLFFKEKRLAITSCIFETNQDATDIERFQMRDVDLRLGISIGVLEQLVEEEYMLNSDCSDCATDMLDLMEREWFRKGD